MAIKTYNDQNMVAIANAIRSKSKNPTTYKNSEMAAAISAIESGFELLPQDTAAGAIANFPDGSDGYPVVELIANIEPKQAGSGDPAPDNVRPISGSTEVKVSKQGKNLISNTSFTYGLPNTSIGASIDTITSSTRYAYTGSNIKGGSYTISSVSNDTDSFNSVLYYGYSNGILAIYGQATINGASTVDFSDCDFIRIAIGSRAATIQVPTDLTEYGTLQVEVGSAATAYEPYKAPEVKTIDLGRTVYGGSLNVTTGELTVTHTFVSFNVADMNNSDSYPGWANSGIRAILGTEINAAYSNQIGNVGTYFNVNTRGNNDIFIMPVSRYGGMSQTDWIENYPDLVVEFAIELPTPQVYQLTPEEVKTLLGVNNIYADTGNVSLTYRADVDLYIAKKIAESA